MANEDGQPPAIGTYVKTWALLFVLAAASYAVGYFQLQGLPRRILLVVLMLLQAGLIVSLLMHLKWERLTLVCAILLPPTLLIALIGIGELDGRHTFGIRNAYFGSATAAPPAAERR